jgi:hypothetical protein
VDIFSGSFWLIVLFLNYLAFNRFYHTHAFFLLLIILTASGYVPGGSVLQYIIHNYRTQYTTTIHSTIHNTQLQYTILAIKKQLARRSKYNEVIFICHVLKLSSALTIKVDYIKIVTFNIFFENIA